MNKNIGFIGGGQMAETIIKGLLQSKTCSSDMIAVCEPIEARRKYLAATYNVEVSATAKNIINVSQTIVLAVKSQMIRDVAKALTIQTIFGTTLLAKETTDHPAVLRDRVTSPGGTTISGLHIPETAGFNGIVISAVEAACKRSAELGKTS